jgi:hypothetical protein
MITRGSGGAQLYARRRPGAPASGAATVAARLVAAVISTAAAIAYDAAFNYTW